MSRAAGALALLLPHLAACPATPPPEPAPPAFEPRALHDWLATFHDGLVLDCGLPALAPTATLDTELPGPTTVVRGGRLVRVVPNPTGIGLLQEGDQRSFLRWEIALGGQSCTRLPADPTPVRGRVLGPEREGVAGATVRGCGIDAKTDEAGAFVGELQPVAGQWWGMTHARCVVEAVAPDGTRGQRVVTLDADRPASLRVQLGVPPLTEPSEPPPEFTELPTASDLPAELAAAPAALVEAATTARAAPPELLRLELLSEPRGMTPAAYLTADLRSALKPGRTWVFRLWDEGVGTRTLRWTVASVDEAGVHAQVVEIPEDGEPGEPSEQVWDDRTLRGDSQFPRSLTTIESGTWDLAGTETPVWILRTSSMQSGEPQQDRVFAKGAPGLAVHASFHGVDRPPGSLDLLRIEEPTP